MRRRELLLGLLASVAAPAIARPQQFVIEGTGNLLLYGEPIPFQSIPAGAFGYVDLAAPLEASAKSGRSPAWSRVEGS